MTSRKPSAPRAVTGVAAPASNLLAYNATLASDIARGLNGLQAELATIKKAMSECAGKQLPFMVAALAGVAPVTAKQWAENYKAGFEAWAIAQGCTISPEGKAMKGGKVSAYAATSYSMVKIAVIGLTNGVAPLADESLGGYVTRTRAICASRGLIEVRANTPTEAKASSGEAKEPALASASKARASALRIVTNNDHALEDAIAFAISDGQVEAFKAWVAKRMAAVKALAED